MKLSINQILIGAQAFNIHVASSRVHFCNHLWGHQMSSPAKVKFKRRRDMSCQFIQCNYANVYTFYILYLT